MPGRNLKRRSFQPRKKAIKPQPQCVSYSEAASGLLTSLQGTDARANLPGSRNYSTHATDTHPRGWVRRAGNTPPCAASFFPYSFFAGEERIWPPEGAGKLAWKKFKTQKLPASEKAIKPLLHSSALVHHLIIIPNRRNLWKRRYGKSSGF